MALRHGTNDGSAKPSLSMAAGELGGDRSVLCDNDHTTTLVDEVTVTGDTHRAVAAVSIDVPAATSASGGVTSTKNARVAIDGTFGGGDCTPASGTDEGDHATCVPADSTNTKPAASGGHFKTPVATERCATGCMPTGLEAGGHRTVNIGAPVACINCGTGHTTPGGKLVPTVTTAAGAAATDVLAPTTVLRRHHLPPDPLPTPSWSTRLPTARAWSLTPQAMRATRSSDAATAAGPCSPGIPGRTALGPWHEHCSVLWSHQLFARFHLLANTPFKARPLPAM